MHSNNNSTFMIGKNLPDIMIRACFKSIFFSFKKNTDAYQIFVIFLVSFSFFRLSLLYDSVLKILCKNVILLFNGY